MKKLTVPLTLVVLGAMTPARAAVCDLEPVPAATLLLPYFEVGPDVDTIFSIHNATPEATLALVTLWTDWGAPTIWFNVFFTGFDVVRIDLADVFEGDIPITADQLSDSGDTISPHEGHFRGSLLTVPLRLDAYEPELSPGRHPELGIRAVPESRHRRLPNTGLPGRS